MKDENALCKRYCKYIHLFRGSGTGVPVAFAQLLHDPTNGFKIDDHLLVTTEQHLYEALKEYSNVVYLSANPTNGESINICAAHCEKLIVHGFWALLEELRIKPKYRTKIVWRTWGHDVPPLPMRKGTPIKNVAKKVINWRRKCVIRSFAMIGIANAVDVVNLEQNFGAGLCVAQLNYPEKNGYELLGDLMVQGAVEKNGRINIMIGHCGCTANNHIGIMDMLQKYRNEDIRIYLPLNYGEPVYIEQVKSHAEKTWGDQAVVLDQPLPYEEYIELLNQIDVAVFDGVPSYALGNIAALTRLQKKLYLNRDGVIRKGFDIDDVPYECTDQIAVQSFEEFAKPVKYSAESKNSCILHQTQEKYVNDWKEALSRLDSL